MIQNVKLQRRETNTNMDIEQHATGKAEKGIIIIQRSKVV